MEEIEKWKMVNRCEDENSLKEAILSLADPETGMIAGRRRDFDAEKMASKVEEVVNGDMLANVLTREYGIRQQALYLKECKRLGI